jgi:hypothetical protein
MSKPKILKILLVTGLLSGVAFASPEFHCPKAKEDTALTRAQQEFCNAVAKFMESDAFKNKEEVQAAAKDILTITSASSPVKVRGGSIHAENPLDTWTQITANKYSAKVPHNNNNYLVLKGFTETGSLVLAPSPIQGTGGWKIEFSNQDADNNEKWNAVLVCSDNNCSGNSLGMGLIYFMTPRADVQLEQTHVGNQDELHFHDTSPRCDDYPHSTQESPVCDIPLRIKITVNGNRYPSDGKTYQCQQLGDDNCVITIGQN